MANNLLTLRTGCLNRSRKSLWTLWRRIPGHTTLRTPIRRICHSWVATARTDNPRYRQPAPFSVCRRSLLPQLTTLCKSDATRALKSYTGWKKSSDQKNKSLKNRLPFRSNRLSYWRYKSRKLSSGRTNSAKCTKKCSLRLKTGNALLEQFKAAKRKRRLSTLLTFLSVRKYNRCKSNFRMKCSLVFLSLSLFYKKRNLSSHKRSCRLSSSWKIQASKSFHLRHRART